jgi:anti-sigma factor RsiW
MSKTKRTCGLDQRWLHYYLDGEFSPAEERVIETHVERCPDCRRELNWLRATEAAMSVAEVPAPPADFTAQLMTRAAAEGALIQPEAHRSRLGWARRVTHQTTLGFRYAWQVVPEVSVPESWRDQAGDTVRQGAATTGRGAWRVSRRLLRRSEEQPELARSRAGDVISQGAATTGRGAWRVSRWLLRRQRRPEELEPSRSRFSLARLGLSRFRLVGQPSH